MTPTPLAWAIFTDEGLIQIWSTARTDLAAVAEATGKEPTPLYAVPVAQTALQPEPSQAARDVLAERQRQIDVEGYHGTRDNHYISYELSKAARAYIEVSWHALSTGIPCTKPKSWPWMSGFKWSDGRTMLVKAGALILAEIERLDRAALSASQTGSPEGLLRSAQGGAE